VRIAGTDALTVHVEKDADGAGIVRSDGRRHRIDTQWRPGQPMVHAVVDGRPVSVRITQRPDGLDLRLRGTSARVWVMRPRTAEMLARLPEKQAADTSRLVISPMPGLVVSVEVQPGQEVKSGEPVMVVEAMKMRNIIRAERDGRIARVNVAAGASVAADEILIELA
jgi:propionyl-CoA carboxylase alpha chain